MWWFARRVPSKDFVFNVEKFLVVFSMAHTGHVDGPNPTEEFGLVGQQADEDGRCSRNADGPAAVEPARQRTAPTRCRRIQSKLAATTSFR